MVQLCQTAAPEGLPSGSSSLEAGEGASIPLCLPLSRVTGGVGVLGELGVGRIWLHA